MKLRLSISGVIVGMAAFAAVAWAAGGGPQTKLISRTSAGDPASTGSSFPGAITPNARWVAFESDADNLPGTSGTFQIFVRDRKTGKTKLVSRTNNGNPAEGGDSFDAAISNNGRFVAFESNATNLPGSIGPTYYQVYVRDLKNGKTKLLSRSSNGDPAAGGDSTDPSISGDGRLAAFESDASNLPGTLSPDDQVYLRDRKTGKTKLISKTTGGTPANEDSEDPAISPNGRIVGFESESTNLPGGLGSFDDEIYVRDLQGGRTLLVSKNSAGDPANDDTDDVVLSGNGRFVAFESLATNLPGSLGPTYGQVYVRDRKQDKTSLISKNNAGDPAANGYSDNASISANGRFVQFQSEADNLPGSNGSDSFVYLRDRDAGKTKLVSRSNNGDPANDNSFNQKNANLISSNPRFATFNSFATNLPGGIGPTYSQAYVRGPRP